MFDGIVLVGDLNRSDHSEHPRHRRPRLSVRPALANEKPRESLIPGVFFLAF